MNSEVIMQFISTLGFPIAVTAFLLWERYTIMKEMTKALQNNTTAVEKFIERIDSFNDKK